MMEAHILYEFLEEISSTWNILYVLMNIQMSELVHRLPIHV